MYMENPNLGSGLPGSLSTVPSPTSATEGQTGAAGGNAKDYDALMSRFGTQGQELSEYRQFFQNIAPLLDKLDQSPELVQAITEGKVDKRFAQAVLDGRVDIRDAAAVTAATEAVKEDLCKKAYDLTTPDAISKLVEVQVSKFRKEFEEKADLQTFQDYTQKFIEKTPDFQEYSEEIDKWLDTHDVADIEVAYYAVKGKMSESKAQKIADVAAAERTKELFGNAQGGAPTSQYSADGTPLVDRFIAGRPNPNSFFPGA